MNASTDTIISDLPRRLEQAVRDESLQSGVFIRKITVRDTGDQVEERGGYVRLVTQVSGAWKYRALSVVVLPPSG